MTPIKKCSTCHLDQPLSAFNRRRAAPDGLQPRCRGCSREWYVAHSKEHKANVRRRKVRALAEYRQRMRDYLCANPCVDCGESDLRVLEFDHREGTSKVAGVALLIQQAGSWSRIEAEIAKCDVRCANCHRKVTAERGEQWRHRVQVERDAELGAASAARLQRVMGLA